MSEKDISVICLEDSGINLMPSDGGLSVEQDPLKEIPKPHATEEIKSEKDDTVVVAGVSQIQEQIAQVNIAGSEGVIADVPQQQEKEFLLTGNDDEFDESDSGSQVIALEDSDSFDQKPTDEPSETQKTVNPLARVF